MAGKFVRNRGGKGALVIEAGRMVGAVYLSGMRSHPCAISGFCSARGEAGREPEKIMRYFPNSAEALYAPVVLPDDAPERVNLPAGFRIMFAGSIGAAQNFGMILDSAERLKSYPDIHWLILGDGRM